MEHSVEENGLHRANTEALICLKAKAYLEIAERLAKGSTEDSKHLRKHKGDVFRLAVLLAENDTYELPKSIQAEEKVLNRMYCCLIMYLHYVDTALIFKAVFIDKMEIPEINFTISKGEG